MAGWYSEGKEGERQFEVEEERRIEESNKPREFWLKVGASSRIIFLDSNGLN